MTGYLDTYFSRVNHMGTTTGERIRQAGIRSFEKWKAESPHTVRDLSVERGLYFDGIILTQKDRSYEKIMLLNVSNTTPLQVGDIMNWKLDDGSIEKWIILLKVKKTNETHQTFWIVRCNYLLKWIDNLGHLHSSWAFVVSSVDSKIKGNYRTWNSLITPQPNKYAEILMPRYPIDRATNFIVEDESWTVIEYDHTSVPGTIYLSLTENKINLIYDDLENDIADTDKLAQYKLLVPEEAQIFNIGELIKPVFTLIKNGEICYADTEIQVLDYNLIGYDQNHELKAIAEGETDLVVRLKDFPDIKNSIHIKISSSEQNFSAYIEGPDKIRLDRYEKYTLVGTDDISQATVNFSINDTNLAKIIIKDKNNIYTQNNYCRVKANDDNILGNITLSATYNGVTYTKEIAIIPLW